MQKKLQSAIDEFMVNKNISNRDKLLFTYMPEIKRIIRRFKYNNAEEVRDVSQCCMLKLIEVLPELEQCNANTGYMAKIITNQIKDKLNNNKTIETTFDEDTLNNIESEKHSEEAMINGIFTEQVMEKINNLDLTDTEQEAINIVLERVDTSLESKHYKAFKRIKEKLGKI